MAGIMEGMFGTGGGSDKHNLGYYKTPEALAEAHPTAEDGDWAIVGATDTVWVWDSDTNAWKDSDQKGQVESVNGKTGAVVLTAEDVSAVPQYETMPTASASNLGNIVQYIGATDSTYTNAYLYKCVSDGQTPATYSWVRVNTQPAGAQINDNSTSLTETWSASKLNTMIGNVETLLSQI